MDNSPQSINPSVKETLVLGVLLTVIWSGVYLFYPDIFEGLQFKLTDAIVAAAPIPASPITSSWSMLTNGPWRRGANGRGPGPIWQCC
jgi:hypothetical protein